MTKKITKTLGVLTLATSLCLSPVTIPSVQAAIDPTKGPSEVQTSRLAGDDRYSTAVRVAQEGWKTTSDYAVLAAGKNNNIVDALTVAPLAKLLNAPILLTEGERLSSVSAAELKRLKVKTVYVTSGLGVIQQPVHDELRALGISVESLGGLDRFDTALNIAKKIAKLKPVNEVILTTAWSNADALSVASIAAQKGIPILLADRSELTAEIQSYISNRPIEQSYILGLEGVISEAIAAKLPNPQRIGGNDRFATNREVLKAFSTELKDGTVYLANGADNHLVDALSASQLAAQTHSPIVLGNKTLSAESADYVRKNLLTNKLVAIGGEAVVAPDNFSSLKRNDAALLLKPGAGLTAQIMDNVVVSTDNATMENLNLAYSLYVSGNNIRLKNLTAAGTIFIDPGSEGSATLEKVTASRIVVLSGAKSSINLNDVNADFLKVETGSPARIVTQGATVLGATLVKSPSILEASAGTFGKITIAALPRSTDIVELRGRFSEKITLFGQGHLLAAANSEIKALEVTPAKLDDKITLEGKYNDVTINKAASVDVAENSVIANLVTLVKSYVYVPPSAKVNNLNSKNTGSVASGGGTVNGSTVEASRPVIPQETTPPVVYLEEAADALTAASFLQGNTSLSSIMTDLNLPTLGLHGSTITWSSSVPGTVSTIGKVTRQSTGDQSVTLTATITYGSLTMSKTFTILVRKSETPVENPPVTQPDSSQTAESNVEAELRAVVDGLEALIINGNSSLSAVTSNLNLPMTGANGTNIVWLSSNINVLDEEGKVTRPTTADTPVTLTAIVGKNSKILQREISVTILKQAPVDTTAAELDAVANNLAVQILGSNTSLNTLTSDLNLISSANPGVTLTWQSSNPAVIATNGRVTRSATGDNSVTLTAQLIKNSQTKTVNLTATVLKLPLVVTDESHVKAAADALPVQVLNGNASLAAITGALNLPTSGGNGTTISWTSSNPAVVALDGTVKRSVLADASVTLTAVISKGDASLSKTLALTVKNYTAPDWISKMTLNVMTTKGEIKKIPYTITEKGPTVSLAGLNDYDYVIDSSITVLRPLTFRARTLTIIQIPLPAGESPLTLDDLIGKDVGTIAYVYKIRQYEGLSVNATLMDLANSLNMPITLTISK